MPNIIKTPKYGDCKAYLPSSYLINALDFQIKIIITNILVDNLKIII
jgi:hypothetical protein